jgi:hypothetical protein
MFWIGIGPSLFVLWIRRNVTESPVWLERQQHLHETRQKDGVSLLRIFRRDLLPTDSLARLALSGMEPRQDVKNSDSKQFNDFQLLEAA